MTENSVADNQKIQLKYDLQTSSGKNNGLTLIKETTTLIFQRDGAGKRLHITDNRQRQRQRQQKRRETFRLFFLLTLKNQDSSYTHTKL